MTYTTFAAIRIGSYELVLTIYECSKKTGIRTLDHVLYPLDLIKGSDKQDPLSVSSIKSLCNHLNQFKLILQQYDAKNYTAVVTGSIGKLRNTCYILHQIEYQCNLTVDLPCSSILHRYYYDALRNDPLCPYQASDIPTLVITILEDCIMFTYLIDSVRSFNRILPLDCLLEFESLDRFQSSYHILLSEMIEQKVSDFYTLYLKGAFIPNIIVVGEYIPTLINYLSRSNETIVCSAEDYLSQYKKLMELSPVSIGEIIYVYPVAMICAQMIPLLNVNSICFSSVTLCDGIAYDHYLPKKRKTVCKDLGSTPLLCAKATAHRYHCDLVHLAYVESIALSIYDSIKKLHGLSKKERIYLQTAVYFLDCGQFISFDQTEELSSTILKYTDLPGLNDHERILVAHILYWNADSTDPDFLTISKLSAILLLARSLDLSRKQKAGEVAIQYKNEQLIITLNTDCDFTLEQLAFSKQIPFFEEVYGIHPLLKQKRRNSDE